LWFASFYPRFKRRRRSGSDRHLPAGLQKLGRGRLVVRIKPLGSVMTIHSNAIRTPIRKAYSRLVLTVIAVSLGVIHSDRRPSLPRLTPRPTININFTFEPHNSMLRKPDGSQQVQGKIVVDMRNGDVWAFPTLSGLGLPYPTDSGRRRPPVSEPIYLGQFDFAGRAGKAFSN
jgi:hypothetical protein